MSIEPGNSQLLELARAGDPAALNQVLACSRQDLRRYAEHHCVVNDVEDAVQETLFTMSRRIGDLRQLESFASWMFRIVKRECNRMRRGWRMVTGSELDEAIMPIDYPEPLDWRIQISRTLAEIPAHYREILLMRDIEGLSLEETAEHLQLTLPATKSRLHRARMLAREMLEPGR
jgi:RNA polymerase sigma factor (sigma-70 family)